MNHITIDTLRIFSVQILIALSFFICRMLLSISRLSTFLLALLTLSIFLIQCQSVLKIATHVKHILHLDNWLLGNWIIYGFGTESWQLFGFLWRLPPALRTRDAIYKNIVIIPAYNQTQISTVSRQRAIYLQVYAWDFQSAAFRVQQFILLYHTSEEFCSYSELTTHLVRNGMELRRKHTTANGERN